MCGHCQAAMPAAIPTARIALVIHFRLVRRFMLAVSRSGFLFDVRAIKVSLLTPEFRADQIEGINAGTLSR